MEVNYRSTRNAYSLLESPKETLLNQSNRILSEISEIDNFIDECTRNILMARADKELYLMDKTMIDEAIYKLQA